jgi:peptide deformylase
MKNEIKIVTIPDDRLRQKSLAVEKFDKDLHQLVEDLKTVLQDQTEPPGLGLSAVQIGILKRVFIAKIPPLSKNPKVLEFVNPEILKYSEKKVSILEGCFSIPQFYGHVIRPAEIDVAAFNQLGKKFKRHYKSFSARVIQHEVDHLNGILFIDHIHAQNGKLYKAVNDKSGKEQLEEVAQA